MMPDFFEIFWSCILWQIMASLFGLQKCILLWSKVVVTGCGRLWSVFVMPLEVLAINASIGNIVSCNGLMEVWKIKVMDLRKN